MSNENQLSHNEQQIINEIKTELKNIPTDLDGITNKAQKFENLAKRLGNSGPGADTKNATTILQNIDRGDCKKLLELLFKAALINQINADKTEGKIAGFARGGLTDPLRSVYDDQNHTKIFDDIRKETLDDFLDSNYQDKLDSEGNGMVESRRDVLINTSLFYYNPVKPLVTAIPLEIMKYTGKRDKTEIINGLLNIKPLLEAKLNRKIGSLGEVMFKQPIAYLDAILEFLEEKKQKIDKDHHNHGFHFKKTSELSDILGNLIEKTKKIIVDVAVQGSVEAKELCEKRGIVHNAEPVNQAASPQPNAPDAKNSGAQPRRRPPPPQRPSPRAALGQQQRRYATQLNRNVSHLKVLTNSLITNINKSGYISEPYLDKFKSQLESALKNIQNLRRTIKSFNTRNISDENFRNSPASRTHAAAQRERVPHSQPGLHFAPGVEKDRTTPVAPTVSRRQPPSRNDNFSRQQNRDQQSSHTVSPSNPHQGQVGQGIMPPPPRRPVSPNPNEAAMGGQQHQLSNGSNGSNGHRPPPPPRRPDRAATGARPQRQQRVGVRTNGIKGPQRPPGHPPRQTDCKQTLFQKSPAEGTGGPRRTARNASRPPPPPPPPRRVPRGGG